MLFCRCFQILNIHFFTRSHFLNLCLPKAAPFLCRILEIKGMYHEGIVSKTSRGTSQVVLLKTRSPLCTSHRSSWLANFT